MQIIIIILILISTGYTRILNIPIQYTSIQEGLNIAESNDTILVSPGIYIENLQWPEIEDLVLIGTSMENTIIDGNNNGSVITMHLPESGLINSSTIISSFTIINGNAQSDFPHDRGGGIFLYNANPILENIIIQDCSALYGGGIATINSNPIIYNLIAENNSSLHSGGGMHCKNSNPQIEQSIFTYNNTISYGGGIYITENSNPIISHCIFTENSAESGGGISCFDGSNPIINYTNISYNSAFRGAGVASFYNSNPNFNYTLIMSNNADSTGGGVFSAFASPIFNNCEISENTAPVGAGITIGSDDTPIFHITTINNNNSSEAGGGIYLNGVSPQISGLTIQGNSSELGGGIFVENSFSEFFELLIMSNSADYGGGIFFTNSDLNISNSKISQNNAISGGGIFMDYYSNIELDTVDFNYNYADNYGGAIALEQGSSLKINRSLIHNNYAPFYGAGIYSWLGADFMLSHVTIVNNFSDTGSGIAAIAESNGFIVNSIIWNNGESGLYSMDSDINLYYSNIENGWPGEKNIRINPQFQEIGYDNYQLALNSRCIDRGTNLFVISGDTLVNSTEIDFNGNSVDLGRYEYSGTVGDLNSDGQINIFDVIQIFSSIIDTYNSEIQLADLNNDETITILDAILLINIIMY